MASTQIVHDHVVLLLSSDDFENTPSWLADNFNILEGGTHTGRSSHNKLIVFADGTYLELFAWTTEPREFYMWADKSPGLIDFALTSMPPSTAESLAREITERTCQKYGDDASVITYHYPHDGGRIRKDGVQVKWKSSRPYSVDVTVSSNVHERTDVPFFCHDVTSRTTRVPFDDVEKTTHPCGAVGIAAVEFFVPKDEFQRYAELYTTILGVPSRQANEHEKHTGEERLIFEIDVPNQGFGSSTIQLHTERHTPDTGAGLSDQDVVISGLVLKAKGEQGREKGVLGSGKIASTVSLR